MTPATWPAPCIAGGATDELALVADSGRQKRLLVIPALFDEANKLRRLTVEVLRKLDAAGIDSFLIDLPGCNESLQSLPDIALEDWRGAVTTAAAHFEATHVLAMRAGALLSPDALPGWLYAPVKGASVLRQMLRARVIASREAGREETREGLLEKGLAQGLDLAGYRLDARMIEGLEQAVPPTRDALRVLEQSAIGGPGLWLRAEPDYDEAQAEALAATIAIGIAT